MNPRRRKFEIWSIISILLFLAFLLFFIYPICTLLKQAFTTEDAGFTLDNFVKFFSKPYYYNTILNSFKVSIAVALVSLALGHSDVLLLLVLSTERRKIHPHLQHSVLHVGTVYWCIRMDSASRSFGCADHIAEKHRY